MNLVHITSSYSSNIYLHINLPPTSKSSLWSLFSYLSHPNPTRIPLSPCVIHSLPITFFLNLSFYLYLARRKSYEAPRYAIFSNILQFHPNSVHIFPSSSCSHVPSVNILALMPETDFHTIQNYRQKYCFVYFNFYVLILRTDSINWERTVPLFVISYSFYKTRQIVFVTVNAKYFVAMVSTNKSSFLLTYSRTGALLEEPPIVQPLKNFPVFQGNRRFNTVFTRAIHYPEPYQSNPHHPTIFL
jgi:hypothetical protein